MPFKEKSDQQAWDRRYRKRKRKEEEKLIEDLRGQVAHMMTMNFAPVEPYLAAIFSEVLPVEEAEERTQLALAELRRILGDWMRGLKIDEPNLPESVVKVREELRLHLQYLCRRDESPYFSAGDYFA